MVEGSGSIRVVSNLVRSEGSGYCPLSMIERSMGIWLRAEH